MASAIEVPFSEHPIRRLRFRCGSGMESPQRDSPKIGARHSPQPQKKLDNPLIPAITAPDTLSEVCHQTCKACPPVLAQDAEAVVWLNLQYREEYWIRQSQGHMLPSPSGRSASFTLRYAPDGSLEGSRWSHTNCLCHTR